MRAFIFVINAEVEGGRERLDGGEMVWERERMGEISLDQTFFPASAFRL